MARKARASVAAASSAKSGAERAEAKLAARPSAQRDAGERSHELQVLEALEKLLASSYTLYLKTHNFHWNVRGPMFTTLHTLFELEYDELALAVDQIAERIRALGHPAPGTYSAFQERSAVKERAGVPNATEMLEELVRDQGVVSEVARDVLHAAEAAGDDASQDLAVQRIQVHEKNAWMLRSHLD